jgi:predicted NBD/HSP70 family sugar kinase
MSNEVYLGIDLGGTRIRAGRFDADLEMEARTETLTLDEEGVDAVIERMIEQVKAPLPA